jgi:hypothetical protein
VSRPEVPEPARLIISCLTPEENLQEDVSQVVAHHMGEIEEIIGPLPFHFTNYYDAEMGAGISRWLWVFGDLVDRADLALVKCLTNKIEQAYTIETKRRINLDPGLLTLGNFVLATGKNNAHRIYLRDGIFADLTLIFRSGSYRPLDWTYPDYADGELISILNQLRKNYKCLLERQALHRE